MSTAILAYVPNIPRLYPDAFLRNLKAFKTDSPVILYSCSKQEGMEEIPDPTPIKLCKNRVAIHNLVFLAGVKIAQRENIKRFIYLELDCRVGRDCWDRDMLVEASQHKDMFVAGTPACYNEVAMTHAQSVSATQYIHRYTESTGLPVPVFPPKTKRPIGCVFIMGAGAVYNTSVMVDLFMGFERDINSKAKNVPAFDLFIGMRCVQLFGPRATNKLPFLTCSHSTYSNKFSTEKDRIEMLKSGKACLIHQVKSDTDCL
jgi:hypothetical protein